MNHPIPTNSLWATPPKPSFFALSASQSQAAPIPSPSRQGLGYFAFPTNGSSSTSSAFNPIPPRSAIEEQEELKRRNSERAEQERKQQDLAWAARLERDAAVRQQRRIREEEEARRGEEAWVRSGGILRDAEGKRDMVRTEAIRAELRLRDVEKRLVEMWERYERRWASLLRGGDGTGRRVRFCDVPWPVDVEGDVGLADLTVARVEDFLLSGLKVRGCEVTRKDRVRSSLLRWHPDKMTAVLARVEEQDVEIVRAGISSVMMCLQQLNSNL